jgi:hypothetical protein
MDKLCPCCAVSAGKYAVGETKADPAAKLYEGVDNTLEPVRAATAPKHPRRHACQAASRPRYAACSPSARGAPPGDAVAVAVHDGRAVNGVGGADGAFTAAHPLDAALPRRLAALRVGLDRGKKTHIYTRKDVILPRQARDKHRESTHEKR